MPSLGWDRFVFVRAAKCPAPCSLTEELTPFTTKDETHLRRPFKPLHVPPEILVEIFGAVPHDFFTEAEGRLLCRDRALVTFALVSRSWNDAAYLVLYGDLRLALGRTREAKFRRTFQANQRLIPLVHKCSVRLVTDEQWDEDYLSSDAGEPLVDKSHAHWPWTEEGEPGPDDEERLAWIRSAVLSKRLWSKDDGFISGSRGRQRGCLSLLQIIAPFLATSCTTLHLLNFDGTLDNRQLAPYTALVKKVRHANLEYPNEFTPLVREMDSLGSLVLHQTKFSSTHPITNDNYEASSSSPSSHRIPRFSPCFNLALLTSRPYPSME